jgi:hypothetical protein
MQPHAVKERACTCHELPVDHYTWGCLATGLERVQVVHDKKRRALVGRGCCSLGHPPTPCLCHERALAWVGEESGFPVLGKVWSVCVQVDNVGVVVVGPARQHLCNVCKGTRNCGSDTRERHRQLCVSLQLSLHIADAGCSQI